MAQGKDLGALVGQIGADIREWERASRRINRDLNKMQSKGVSAARKMQQAFNRMSAGLTRVGRTMTRRITLPLAAAGVGAIKLSSDFESSMAKIEGLVGVAGDEVDKMRGRVLALGGETAQRPRELADALFFITSAGLRGEQALEVLEASAKAATAGLGETKVVADLVTSAVNAYGAEHLSAAQATDVLTAAVREGKAEAPQLAASLGQVLPVASQMGVSFDQVGAAVAAMTRTGTDAGTAAIQLRQILFKLLKPMTQSEEAARAMGTSTAEMRETLRGPNGLVKVLSFLREQMKTNEQAMAQIFPNVRALAGALDLMGANADENIAIFERMTNTTGTMEEAFGAAEDTMRVKFGKALARLEEAAIRFGDTMLPIAKRVVDFATNILTAITNMSEQSRERLLKLAAIIGAAGPIAFAVGKLIAIVTGAASIIATAFAALTSPIGLTVIAIGSLIVLGKNLFDNWKVIAAELEALWEGIKLTAVTISNAIVQAFVNSLDFVVSAMAQAAARFAPTLLPGLAKVRGGLAQLSQSSEDSLKTVRKGFEEAKIEAVEARSKMVSMSETAMGLWQDLKDLGMTALEASGLMDMFSISLGTATVNAEMLVEKMKALKEQRQAEFGMGIDRAGLPTEQFKAGLESMRAATGEFVDSTKIALRGTSSNWADFVNKSKEAGFDFVSFLTQNVAGAIENFAVSIGKMFIGAGNEFSTGLEKVLLLVIDFAKQLGKLLIGIGTAIAFVPGLQGPAAGYIAGGAALLSLATAAGGLIQQRIEKRKERQQQSGPSTRVNDALIRDDGSIVRLNPRDDILAMKDFTQLGSVQPQRAAGGLNESTRDKNFKEAVKEGIVEGMREGRFNFPLSEFQAAQKRFDRKEKAIGNQ